MRSTAAREVSRFIVDVRERVGGTGALARYLADMGFTGEGGGPMVDATIRTWIRGEHQPPSAALLALAAYCGLSLDEYIYGREIRGAVIELTGRLATRTEGSA